ncbi:MAG: glycosyltransferase family 39 protein, partial [Thermodesulfobacteriota bacterium]
GERGLRALKDGIIEERPMEATSAPGAARLTIFVALGIAVVLAAYYSPWFSDPQGALSGRFALSTGAAAGLVVAGCAAWRGLRQTAFWTLLAFAGQASALQLIEAGHQVRYQHYISPAGLVSEAHPVVIVILVFQIAAVGYAAARGFPGFRAWASTRLKTWQFVAAALVTVATSAVFSRDKGFYIQEVIIASFIQFMNLANVILIAGSIPDAAAGRLRTRLGEIFSDAPQDAPGGGQRIDAFVIAAALWVVAASVLLTYVAYDLHPHVSDEVAYLYLARNFAEGRITMGLPPVPEAFDLDLMFYDSSRWFSPVPPGWPAALAVGVRLGVPWLVNPVLGGASVVLAYLLVKGLYGRRTARLSIALLSLSPWFLFMSMNFMTHTFTLAAALAAAVCVMYSRKNGLWAWALAGGAAAAFVALSRPLEGMAVGGMLGLWALTAEGKGIRVAPAAAFAVGLLALTALVLPYNEHLTGSAARFPLMAYTDKYLGPGVNALGFGPDRGPGWALDPFPGHGLRDVVVNAGLNMTAINTELFGWATGSVLFIALLLFSGAMRRADYLMWAFIAAVAGIHSFYWYAGGPDFGARYWYPVIIPSVVLTARGVLTLADGARPGERAGGESGGWRVVAAVLLLSVMATGAFVPWRAADKYKNYLAMRPDIRTIAKERSFGRSLVLIRGERFPDYASAAVYNPLDLNTDTDATIYAWARDPGVAERAARAYPGRPVWLVDGPTVTGAGFRVAAGPVTTGELTALLSAGSRKAGD